MILYNLHTDGDQYRITKFDDGNPVSSYLLTEHECECPAGHRPTCRHRQMLPLMLADGILNTHYFMCYGSKSSYVTDFEGNHRVPPAIEPAIQPIPPGEYTITRPDETGTSTILDGAYAGRTVHIAIDPTDIRSPSDVYTEKDFIAEMFAKDVTPAAPSRPWRRL